MSVQVVTIANHRPRESHYIFDEMKRSVQRFGFDPVVLGWGERWGGLGSKPRILKAGIESGKVSADTIVFIDAFDVVLASSPRVIAEEFKSETVDVVWGAERNFWHRNWEEDYRSMDELKPSFPDTPSGFNYLNSGFCVAKTQAMYSLLESMNVADIPDDHTGANGKACHPCDQSYYGRAFCKVPQAVPMKVDTECRYVANLHSVSTEDIEFGLAGIRLLPTGTLPMAFHFNGGSKTDGLMGPILSALLLR